MRSALVRAGILLPVLTLSFSIVNCTKKGDRDVSQELVKPLGDGEVILEYSGGKITAGDVRERMAPRFQQARENLLNDYVRAARDVLFERNRKGAPDAQVTDQELASYMRANHIPDSEREKIRSFLETEKKRLAGEDQKRALFESLNVKNRLGAARFDVEATSNMPQMGPSDAKVTVQVFCDFANPMCNRTRLLMGTTRAKYGEKVRWVYRLFPVASNAGGFEAAAAALCAHDQGQFWPTFEKLSDLGPMITKKDLVEELGAIPKIDATKLRACLQSEDVKKRVNSEVKAATDLGLTATPVYFVNGTKAEDSEQVPDLIQSQLAR